MPRARSTSWAISLVSRPVPWDYLVMIAASSMPRCRTVIDDLFLDAPNVKRYETSFVFGPVKRGLNIPLR
jgi:Lrp/AsnC family leucine-responsive transcriptional regulator